MLCCGVAQVLNNLHLAPFPRPVSSLVADYPLEQGHKGWQVCLAPASQPTRTRDAVQDPAKLQLSVSLCQTNNIHVAFCCPLGNLESGAWIVCPGACGPVCSMQVGVVLVARGRVLGARVQG